MIVLIRKDEPSMDLNKASSQPQCPLLALPAELRNHIWEYLLVQHTRTTYIYAAPARFANVSETSRRNKRFCANILRTCKQINAEGTPILYGENVFRAHSQLLTTLPSFLLYTVPEKITLDPVKHPRVAKMIRRYYIYVRLDTDPRFSRKQVEESFTGVQELEIEVYQAMFAGSDFSVLKLFEGVRGVGKATIKGSLGDGRYANWLIDCMQQSVGSIVMPFYEEYVGGMRGWDAWSKGMR